MRFGRESNTGHTQTHLGRRSVLNVHVSLPSGGCLGLCPGALLAPGPLPLRLPPLRLAAPLLTLTFAPAITLALPLAVALTLTLTLTFALALALTLTLLLVGLPKKGELHLRASANYHKQ